MVDIHHNNITFFKNKGPFSLTRIAHILNTEIYQNGIKLDLQDRKSVTDQVIISNVATLKSVTKGSISFITTGKYLEDFVSTDAEACIASEKFISKAPSKLFILVSDNPKLTYAKLLDFFYESEIYIEKFCNEDSFIDPLSSIGENAQIGRNSYIGKNAVIGEGTKIYPNVFIGNNVVIGKNCIIHNNVSITHSIIGNNNIIHSGAKIGQDGFGYITEKGMHYKIPQVGRVIIGNDVEIGANSTIDRGSLDDTVISDMCKLDNLVQIGHNVELGKGCIIVSQVGISGSTKIGKYVVIGGQAGIADHISIGDFGQIAAKSGVMKNIDYGNIVAGIPAQPIKNFWKQSAILQKMIKRSV